MRLIIFRLKPRPNAFDFSLDITRHCCRAKFRGRLATLYSVVEWCWALSSVVESNLIKVKIVEWRALHFFCLRYCRELLRTFGPVARLFTQQYWLTHVQSQNVYGFLHEHENSEYEVEAIAKSRQSHGWQVESVLPPATRRWKTGSQIILK